MQDQYQNSHVAILSVKVSKCKKKTIKDTSSHYSNMSFLASDWQYMTSY